LPARFARLRITGFKSFADATAIEILPGLTGIVGPNGCGKSNVVDALRWAMGEASAKSMRGGEMDDVIFAGTLSRPARSIAEVSISLTDTAGVAPPPFQAESELQINRKIERGGGSTYRVNGRETRARDVATLFADLASGARNSAMISQGRVSALVGARPDERRAILEEAAGISGLHARRHEAELKLKATEQNLARAEDLRAQQDARLADLRKQARQANRYRTISDAIRDAEAEYFAIERHLAEQQRDHAEATLEAARAAVADAHSTRDAALISESNAAGSIPALRACESMARTALERARIHLEQIEMDITRTRALRSEAEQRLTALRRDHAHAERTQHDAETARARLTHERNQIQQADAEAPAQIEAARHTLAEAALTLERTESAEQAATDHAAYLAAAHQAAVARLKPAREKAAQAKERLSKAAQAEQRAIADLIPPERLARTDAERQTAESALIAAEASRDRCQIALNDAEANRIDAAHIAAVKRADALAADAALAKIRIEAEALTSILARKFGHEPDPILDAITVPPGLEHALGSVMRDELAIGTRPDAPRHWRCLDPLDVHPTLPPLSSMIEAPPALQRALGHILVLPDGADGDALHQSLHPGETLVSRDGGIWRWDGLVSRAGAPSEAGLRLTQRNRLAALQRDLAGATSHAAICKADRQTAEAAEQATRRDEDEARRQRNAADGNVDRARSLVRQLQDAWDRLSAEAERQAGRVASATELRTRLDAEYHEAAHALAAAQTELDGLDDIAAARAALDSARRAVQVAKQAELAASQRTERLMTEAEQRARRTTVIARELEDWQERSRDIAMRLTDLTARLREAETALAEIPTDTRSSAARDAARVAAVQAETAHRTAVANLTTAESDHQRCTVAARTADQRVASAREVLIGAEAFLRQAEFAWGTVAERILERLGVEPTLPEVKNPAPDAGERARKRFERLTREREEMGPVNLRADIEVGEIESRLAEIERERDEIFSAIAKLRGSIGNLNREGRERLSAVFTEIDRHFQSLFIRMFGGGRAHLALTGSDDPLHAGLEIFAEPPGKKLATLSLLSGGEQALTALSLIFAVFRCNPAPISVLDEVDAPLDDANVDRFCNLLDDMSRETGTRFLVVTHHHHTMARMDRLYGVTMQERGISRILSVDLGTATALVEHPEAVAAE